jgi:VWFA-related protein
MTKTAKILWSALFFVVFVTVVPLGAQRGGRAPMPGSNGPWGGRNDNPPDVDRQQSRRDRQKADATFTARSELVLVPVLVTDSGGKHVSHLKKEDFVIKQDGNAQTIAAFEEFEASPVPSVHRATAPDRTTFTNTFREQAPKQLVIIAIDSINTPVTDQSYARQQLIKFLTESLEPGALVSLVSVERGRIRVLHDFTEDSKLLIAALKKVRGQPDALQGIELDENEAVALQAEVENLSMWDAIRADSMMRVASEQRRLAVLDTLSAIQQLARAFGGVPGRKALVWATASFPFSINDGNLDSRINAGNLDLPAAEGQAGLSDVLPAYEKTWQVLNDANMAVYPVDVRGLVNTSMISASTRIPTGTGSANPTRRMNAMMRRQQAQQMDTIATMQSFAEMTGGKAYYNTNDLARSFRNAADDSAAYYILGFYLNKESKPGWHKLHVEVTRPGTHVRARTGFFVTRATQDPAVTRKLDIDLALSSPLEFTGLPLTLRWTGVQGDPNAAKRKMGMTVAVGEKMVGIDEGDDNHALVEFVVSVRRPEGATVNNFEDRIEGHLKPESVRKIRDSGLVHQHPLELEPGDYRVVVVVRDGITGRVGSVIAPLSVK